jgi:hypothetical protein
MDPIHHIVPVSPTIPPITPTPLIGGIARDERQRSAEEERRRRRRPRPDQPASDERDGDENPGLHVDVTA